MESLYIHDIYTIYTWYIHGIYMVYTNVRWRVCTYMIYIYNIYMVYTWYTWYMNCICRPDRFVRYIPCQYLMGLFCTFFYNDMPVKHYVYPKDIVIGIDEETQHFASKIGRIELPGLP
jgi:hypothetical protein